MNERLVVYSFSVLNPQDSAALGDLALYFMVPFSATLVYASAGPWDDDTDLTMDLMDDGSAIITAMVCADKEAPGEWISTHAGGTETPVAIAAGSEMTVDFNNAAAANRVDVTFHFLSGESWG
jgi:hypothetical protein